MQDDEIFEALLHRRLDPNLRIDMKRLKRPELFELVSPAAVRAAEDSVGVRFPSFLKRLYLEVGNGGFGPGAGLLGLQGGYPDADGRTLVERYRWLVGQGWPVTLLPMNDWGAAVWSCVDSASPAGAVITSDYMGFVRTAFTLRSWFEAWLSGVDLMGEMFEFGEATILNPFTRKPKSVKTRVRAIGEPWSPP
jgi:hypothetical protein